MSADYEEELVSVALIREDLRLLLVAAQTHLLELQGEGKDAERLRLAIERVGSTASGAEWQPKRRAPPE